ncbi:fungal-specific transcription factor domain-containing protein [Aspergillus heterothallicus]
MHLARSVLHSARLNDPSIDRIPVASRRAPSDPVRSQQAASADGGDMRSTFPQEEVALSLIDMFFDQYSLQYPIISQEWLLHETREYYRRRSHSNVSTPKDTRLAFMLQMIFAISLLAISKGNQDEDALLQAERFYSAAMVNLTIIMETKSLETLQGLLLLLLYSLLHFSATPIWHMSGLCMRMCIDLGLHSETTIKASLNSVTSEEDIDCKRRLFWVTYTFDRTLSIMLGRPFTLEDKYIDVAYPDKSLPEERRKAMIHWVKLQRLQSLAVSRSHTSSSQLSESISTWEKEMAQALKAWNDEALSFADGSRYTVDWWRYWYHNSLLLLHRPTPNAAAVGPDSLSTSYAAAKNVIEASFIRLHTGLLDFVCVDLHYQFMAGITLLFLIWNSTDIRQTATEEWTSFKSCLVQWELVLDAMAIRWDRASRAKEVAHKLSNATVSIVEREMSRPTTTEGVVHRGASKTLLRDHDRARFIMQQLGSSGAPHERSPGTFGDPPCRGQTPRPFTTESQDVSDQQNVQKPGKRQDSLSLLRR